MSAMADKIMKRVRAKGRGWVFTPKHFIDFGTRGSVDMALSRLAQAGEIRRIGRGLYDYPQLHDKLGALTPDAEMIAPRKPTNILRPPQSSGAKRAWRFAVNPERPDGVRGQNRNLFLISVAERNQHRHSMTPGRLAAVKDRGCPPILACCGYRLASKNRLPPRPLARRQRVRAAVPEGGCLWQGRRRRSPPRPPRPSLRSPGPAPRARACLPPRPPLPWPRKRGHRRRLPPLLPSEPPIARRCPIRSGRVSSSCARPSKPASAKPSKGQRPPRMKPTAYARTAPRRMPRPITIPSAKSARPTALSAPTARSTPDGVRRGSGHLPPDRAALALLPNEPEPDMSETSVSSLMRCARKSPIRSSMM